MEVSDIRRRVRDTIERARQAAAERRTRNDRASAAWATVRDDVVVPVCRGLANVLRAEGYPFQVSTPEASVHLTSERSPQDGFELFLDTSGPAPRVACRVTRVRGRSIIDEEHTLAPDTAIEAITDEQVLALLLRLLPPFVER